MVVNDVYTEYGKGWIEDVDVYNYITLTETCFLDQNGKVINPKSLSFQGNWSIGLANLLPQDFIFTGKIPTSVSNFLPRDQVIIINK